MDESPPYEEGKHVTLKKLTMNSIQILPDDNNMFLNRHFSESSDYFNDNTNPPSFNITFLIQGTKYPQNLSQILHCCPLISKVLKKPKAINLKSSPLIIDLPSDVTIECLQWYFNYISSPGSIIPSFLSLMSIVIIAEYFENRPLSDSLLHKNIIPSFGKENVVDYLIISNEKIKEKEEGEEEEEEKKVIWREMYKSAKEWIIKGMDCLTVDGLMQLHHYDGRMFDEILQAFCHMIDCRFNEENYDTVYHQNNNTIVAALSNIVHCDNNLLVVINELYKEKFFSKAIEQLVLTTNPYMIEFGYNQSYKEYEMALGNNELSVIVSTSYNQGNDEYNITIINKNHDKIHRQDNKYFLYSMLYLNNLRRMKGTPCLFLTNFSKCTNYSLKLDTTNKTSRGTRNANHIYLHMKVDYMFSTLINSLIDHIEDYLPYFNTIAGDISLLTQLILSFKSKGLNQNIILTVVINWLSNPSNSSSSNVVSLSELINWRDIKVELISEFYIKYSLVLKKQLTNTLLTILKENKLDGIIIHMSSSLQENITKAFPLMVNDKKRNKNVICSSIVNVEYYSNNNSNVNGNDSGGKKRRISTSSNISSRNNNEKTLGIVNEIYKPINPYSNSNEDISHLLKEKGNSQLTTSATQFNHSSSHKTTSMYSHNHTNSHQSYAIQSNPTKLKTIAFKSPIKHSNASSLINKMIQ